METVSVKQARQRLAELVDAAEAGESVVITRRGKRVAKLSPATEPKAVGFPDLSAFRASLGPVHKKAAGTITALRRSQRY